LVQTLLEVKGSPACDIHDLCDVLDGLDSSPDLSPSDPSHHRAFLSSEVQRADDSH